MEYLPRTTSLSPQHHFEIDFDRNTLPLYPERSLSLESLAALSASLQAEYVTDIIMKFSLIEYGHINHIDSSMSILTCGDVK